MRLEGCRNRKGAQDPCGREQLLTCPRKIVWTVSINKIEATDFFQKRMLE